MAVPDREPSVRGIRPPRRSGPTFLLLLLAVVSLARATELDIPVFAGGYGTAFYEETAREFERLRPGVRIRLYGDPRISDKLRVRMIDGNLPDAALPFNLLIPALVKAGRLRDLSPYLDEPNWDGTGRWRDGFVPGALDSWLIDGRPYGLPLSYACWTIYYNRGVFRQHGWTVPRTWDEFFALCERIQETGLAPVSLTGIYGNYPDAVVRSAYYSLAGRDGWRALNDQVPGSRTDGRYERAAAVLQRITQRYTLRGWEGTTHTGAQLAFFEGRAAMTVSGSWMQYEMAGKIPAGFELGVMNFPVFPDGVGDPTAIQASADNFFVFATGDAERERLTIDFLKFMTSPARAAAFVRRFDAPVAVKGVPIEAYSPAMRPVARMIVEAREAFNMPQLMLEPPTVRQALVDSRLALMSGRITPRALAERVEAAAAQDRGRAAQPNRVEFRHPVAGTLLLVFLAAVGIAVAWRKGARLLPASGRGRPVPGPADAAGYFGRMRPGLALGFVGPALLLYAALVIGPAVAAGAWAFARWDGLGEREWAGLYNFKTLLFESDLFWAALRNNAYLMLVPAAIVVPLALTFAYLLHRDVLGAKFFRAVFLFPNLLGGIAATLLWLGAYEAHGGLVNAGLVALGDLLGSDWLRSFESHPWLAPGHLYGALIPIYIWMACGFNLVLYLAAMEGIDPQLYEAAELDGAPAWRQFFSITLPLIWEVVTVSAVFLIIAGLNAFEMIWLLTSQDPDTSTHTLGTWMVTSMFKEFQVGRATAIAVVLFILVLAGSAALLRALKREAVDS